MTLNGHFLYEYMNRSSDSLSSHVSIMPPHTHTHTAHTTSHKTTHTHTHTHSQAVELENTIPRNVTKYVILITTIGHQDTEETLVLGTEQEGSM